MAKSEAIPQEVHEKAGAVARALMGMPYKPIEESKKGGPALPTQSADSSKSDKLDESNVLLKEEKPLEE